MPDRMKLRERPQEERQAVPQLGDLGAELVVNIPDDEAGIVEKRRKVEQSRIARSLSGNVEIHAEHDGNENAVTDLHFGGGGTKVVIREMGCRSKNRRLSERCAEKVGHASGGSNEDRSAGCDSDPVAHVAI